MRKSLLFLIILIGSALTSCDEGLAPPPVEPGLSGWVTVVPPAPWPPVDSVRGLWLFASLQYPLDSATVLTGVLIEPRRIFLYPSLSESLPYGVDSVAFQFALAPGTYRYVGVIQQVRPELLVRNFRVVAMLEDPLSPGQPRTVVVGPREKVEGIQLRVDFGAPPPQPFEAPR